MSARQRAASRVHFFPPSFFYVVIKRQVKYFELSVRLTDHPTYYFNELIFLKLFYYLFGLGLQQAAQGHAGIIQQSIQQSLWDAKHPLCLEPIFLEREIVQ